MFSKDLRLWKDILKISEIKKSVEIMDRLKHARGIEHNRVAYPAHTATAPYVSPASLTCEAEAQNNWISTTITTRPSLV